MFFRNKIFPPEIINKSISGAVGWNFSPTVVKEANTSRRDGGPIHGPPATPRHHSFVITGEDSGVSLTYPPDAESRKPLGQWVAEFPAASRFNMR